MDGTTARALRLGSQRAVIFLNLGRPRGWASHSNRTAGWDLCSGRGICWALQSPAQAGFQAMFSGLVFRECCWLHSGNGQGHTLGSTFIHGCVEPQAVPPWFDVATGWTLHSVKAIHRTL